MWWCNQAWNVINFSGTLVCVDFIDFKWGNQTLADIYEVKYEWNNYSTNHSVAGVYYSPEKKKSQYDICILVW